MNTVLSILLMFETISKYSNGNEEGELAFNGFRVSVLRDENSRDLLYNGVKILNTLNND